MKHNVVMVATSYPRFPGDGIGSFMEPIAKGIAARGHEVHLVAPWHPAITRDKSEDGVHFHFFKYAPVPALNVFGYAGALRADVALRWQALAAAPLALATGWFKAKRVADKRGATIMHGHWVIPGGAIAARAAGSRPLVVSLHGSDVFLAERNPIARWVARQVFAQAKRITACSDDLRLRAAAIGADPARLETLPYGVDLDRFAPSEETREEVRQELGIGDAPLILAAGRLVRKKGFEYLIDAARAVAATHPNLRVIIAGDGDLTQELSARARAAGTTVGGGPIVQLVGARPQPEIARLFAAADVVVIPSVHDEAGNVDGLPNTALEALASGTPVIATMAGGLGQLIEHNLTGRLIQERNAAALALAIRELLASPDARRAIGERARARMSYAFSWDSVAKRFEEIYTQACEVRA